MNVTSYFLSSLPMIRYLKSYFVLSRLVIKKIDPGLLFMVVYHREFLENRVSYKDWSPYLALMLWML